jgi:lipase chaperone LimK
MKPRLAGRKLLGGVILILALIMVSRSFQKTTSAPETISELDPATENAVDWALRPDAPASTPPAVTASVAAAAPAPHPSLDGTDVNGGIRVDENGRVVLHRDIRRLFDYYLSLRGRMDNESIRALLRQHLEASQPRSVIDQALALFDQYLSLIDAEAKLSEEWTQRDLKATDQVAAVLDERRNLRREHLGDALTEAFYEDQEQYEAYQLERMKIGTNPNLSEAEKKSALAAAENLLSPQQREIRKQTFAWLDIKQLARQPIESLDVDGAEAIRQRFGDNALDRLAAVEQERRTWEQKRETWLTEKAQLATRNDLSEDEKKNLLLESARAYLDDSDIRRMQALDSDGVAF